MTHIGNSNLPRDPYQGADGALFGFGGLAALAVAATSLSSIFATSLTFGIAALAVTGLFVAILILVLRSGQRPMLPLVLLALGAAWTAGLGFIVFDNHWLAFTPAAWVLDGLFIAALISGAWAQLKTWAKLLAALSAAALVTATLMVPRPPGGDGPLDTAEKWKIDVDVADSADNAPLEGARVLCGTVMQWEAKVSLADTTARTSGSDGRVETWEFDEDPRLKIVICNVWKDADDGNAGYPAQVQIVAAPAGGGEYALHFELTETPHPDTAFLALDATGAFAQQSWFYLTFEVWSGEPQGNVGDQEGPQPLARKTWADMRGGFTLPASNTADELTLRYHYEGPARGEGLTPPYNETQSVPVGAIPGGTRHRIALRIPGNQQEN